MKHSLPKRANAALVPFAVAGLLAGLNTACTKSEEAPAPKKEASLGDAAKGAAEAVKQAANELATMAKHACKGRNACKGRGGCKSGDAGCAGKNSCKGKGGCATAAHHGCAGQNECKSLGGCSSGDNGCKAKNSCKGKGGCAVPILH